MTIAPAVASPLPVTNASATEGTRYREGVSSSGGAVATVSRQAGRAVSLVQTSAGSVAGASSHIAAPMERSRLDFREEAPAKMSADAYQVADIYRSFTGRKTICAPGTVAGMAKTARRYGTMLLAKLIRPAKRLAARGVRVTEDLSASMAANSERLRLLLVGSLAIATLLALRLVVERPGKMAVRRSSRQQP